MYLRLILLISSFCLVLLPPVLSANTLDKNANGTLDANLADADIRQVFEFFTENYGISFKEAGPIPRLTVSSAFRNKNTEEALRILLSQINYAFVYNASGGIVEVTLFNSTVKSTPSKTQTAYGTTAPLLEESVAHQPILAPDSNPINEITTFVPRKMMPGGGPSINGKPLPVENDITTFKPIRNVPPPGQ